MIRLMSDEEKLAFAIGALKGIEAQLEDDELRARIRDIIERIT